MKPHCGDHYTPSMIAKFTVQPQPPFPAVQQTADTASQQAFLFMKILSANVAYSSWTGQPARGECLRAKEHLRRFSSAAGPSTAGVLSGHACGYRLAVQ